MSPIKEILLYILAYIVCFTLLYIILRMYQISVFGMVTRVYVGCNSINLYFKKVESRYEHRNHVDI